MEPSLSLVVARDSTKTAVLHNPVNGPEAHLELVLEVEVKRDSDPTALLKEGDVDREGGGGEERRGGEAR